MRRAKIVATLGPASRSPEVIQTLVNAGMDVARLNFSHGSHDDHRQSFEAVRRASEKAGRPIAILQDLGGPKLRLDRPVHGLPGDVVDLRLPATVLPGDRVLLSDGIMELEVIDLAHRMLGRSGTAEPSR